MTEETKTVISTNGDFETVEIGCMAGGIRAGDYVPELFGLAHRVESVDSKVKWTTIVTDDDRKLRIERDRPVTVRRVQETKQASYRKLVQRRLTDLREHAEAYAERIKTPAIIDFSRGWIYNDLEQVGETHAEWSLVYGPFVAITSREENALSDLEALCVIKASLQSRLLRDEWRGTSTSQWSNVMDAKFREVACNFMERGFDNLRHLVDYAREAGMLDERCEELLSERH